VTPLPLRANTLHSTASSGMIVIVALLPATSPKKAFRNKIYATALHTYNVVGFAVVINVVVEVDSFVVNEDLNVWLSLLLN